MIRAIHSEFVKLRTLRSTWFSLAGVALIGVLSSAFGDVPRGSVDQYGRFGVLYAALRIAVAVFAVMLVTGEFRNTAVISSALAVPKRWTFHLAKIVAVALYGTMLAVVGSAIAALIMSIRSGSFDIGIFSEVSGASAHSFGSESAPPLLYFWLIGIGFAVFSGAIAFALRSQPGAIVLAAVGPLFGLFWQSRWNPFVLADAAVFPEGVRVHEQLIDRTSALWGFWAFVLAVVVISGFVHSRRDI